MPSSFRFLLCAALACAGFLSPGFAASRAQAQDAADAGTPAAPEGDQAATGSETTEPSVEAPTATAVAAPATTTAAPPAEEAAAPDDPAAEEAAPAEEAPPAPPKRFWRNSLFLFTPSVTTHSFSGDAQLTYNPTVSLNFRLVPRFYLTDTLFLRVRQDLNVEVTNSDFDTYARQPLLSDTFIDLMRPALVNAGGFVLTAGLRVSLPVSIASRYNNLVLGTGFLANASYQIPNESLHLSVLFDLSYTHNWQSTNTPTFFNDANSRGDGAATICPGGANGCAAGGFTNVSDALLFGPTLLWVPDGEKLNISATYYWAPRLGLPLGTQSVDTATGSVALTDSATHWRVLQYFGVSVAYDVLPWLNLSATYGTFTTQLSFNGKLRNPVWGPDTTLSMTAVVTLDQLYDIVAGESTDLTPEQLRRIRNGQAAAPSTGRAF